MSAANGKRAKIAIIGDRFMLPSMFEEAICARCGDGLTIETLELPWPDEHMEHGYAVPGMDGLKEYQGDLEEIIRFVDDAEIVVTQLAPFSAAMLDRLPNLKLIAVSRGGSVNIDMNAARKRDILVVNTPGRNASAVAEFTIGAKTMEGQSWTLIYTLDNRAACEWPFIGAQPYRFLACCRIRPAHAFHPVRVASPLFASAGKCRFRACLAQKRQAGVRYRP